MYKTVVFLMALLFVGAFFGACEETDFILRADFTLADRMAKTGERARAFLAELKSKTEAHFQRENDDLRSFHREYGGKGDLKPWDVGYWVEKQRRALYDFDEPKPAEVSKRP